MATARNSCRKWKSAGAKAEIFLKDRAYIEQEAVYTGKGSNESCESASSDENA